MDMAIKDQFLELGGTYFPGAELPITLFYTDDPGEVDKMEAATEWRCFLGQLAAVRKGRSVCFDNEAISCSGGKRYLGFDRKLMPNFEYVLSCGIPGQMEGERYKKSPEIVIEMMKKAPVFDAPARYAVFKRWDRLEADDQPAVIMFQDKPDVLSGLFTLSGFDESDINAVMAPFSAGCASICQYPYLEQQKEKPRAVIGMFDVSARPWVKKDTLSFAVPMKKFTRMVGDMEESFLMTPSWARIRKRMSLGAHARILSVAIGFGVKGFAVVVGSPERVNFRTHNAGSSPGNGPRQRR